MCCVWRICWIASGRIGFLSYEVLHGAYPDLGIGVAHFKKKYEEYVVASNQSKGVLQAQNKVLLSVLWNDAVGEVNYKVAASSVMCGWFGVGHERVEKLLNACEACTTKKHGMVDYRINHPPSNATSGRSDRF